jgi:thioredoxin reductase (NADPH)
MQERVLNKENITVLFKHQTLSLTGKFDLDGADLVKNKGEENEENVHIDIDGFFLAIGHQPNSKVFADYIETDEQGYIVTKNNSAQTSVEGVYAAGDVADPIYRQAITSAGSGCKAAIEAERYLLHNGLK